MGSNSLVAFLVLPFASHQRLVIAFGNPGQRCFAQQQRARHRDRVFQLDPHDLRRIDDSSLDEVDVLARRRVQAEKSL